MLAYLFIPASPKHAVLPLSGQAVDQRMARRGTDRGVRIPLRERSAGRSGIVIVGVAFEKKARRSEGVMVEVSGAVRFVVIMRSSYHDPRRVVKEGWRESCPEFRLDTPSTP